MVDISTTGRVFASGDRISYIASSKHVECSWLKGNFFLETFIYVYYTRYHVIWQIILNIWVYLFSYYCPLFSLHILINTHRYSEIYLHLCFLIYMYHVSTTNIYALVLAWYANIQNHFKQESCSPVWCLISDDIVDTCIYNGTQNGDMCTLIYISHTPGKLCMIRLYTLSTGTGLE